MNVILVILTLTGVISGTASMQPVSTAEQAIQRFSDLTDLAATGDSQDDLKDVSLVEYKDSTTAFLSQVLSGRPAWRIRYDSFSFSSEDLDSLNDHQRTAIVFIDSATGQLLRATFTVKGGEGGLVREPTSEESERALGVAGERYHALPDKDPRVTLRQAIDACSLTPQAADEIIVSYVMYSLSNVRSLDPRPAWVIYMRGAPPVGSPVKHEYMRTHRRFVIDAIDTTAQVLMHTNVPYPDLNE